MATESDMEKPDLASQETTIKEGPFTIYSWSFAWLNLFHITGSAEFYLLGFVHLSLASAVYLDVRRKLLDAEDFPLEGIWWLSLPPSLARRPTRQLKWTKMCIEPQQGTLVAWNLQSSAGQKVQKLIV